MKNGGARVDNVVGKRRGIKESVESQIVKVSETVKSLDLMM